MVARFWRRPYAPAALVRWGTQLHDRFLMPYFVEQDFADVIVEMQQEGFGLQSDWFAPHFEFRFPKYGDFATRGMLLELRQALEPWHVMGEEGSPGGTVRYVDSSVERLQVKVSGLVPNRHLVTCNGRAMPMQPTGKAGEFVGIIFDSNIQSLVLDCIYTDKQARAVSVDSAAIIEALRNVYEAQPLVDEMLSAK